MDRNVLQTSNLTTMTIVRNHAGTTSHKVHTYFMTFFASTTYFLKIY